MDLLNFPVLQDLELKLEVWERKRERYVLAPPSSGNSMRGRRDDWASLGRRFWGETPLVFHPTRRRITLLGTHSPSDLTESCTLSSDSRCWVLDGSDVKPAALEILFWPLPEEELPWGIAASHSPAATKLAGHTKDRWKPHTFQRDSKGESCTVFMRVPAGQCCHKVFRTTSMVLEMITLIRDLSSTYRVPHFTLLLACLLIKTHKTLDFLGGIRKQEA